MINTSVYFQLSKVLDGISSNPVADDFCRDVAISEIFNPKLKALFIVRLSHLDALEIVGAFGSPLTRSTFYKIEESVKSSIRSNAESSTLVIQAPDTAGFRIQVISSPTSTRRLHAAVLFFDANNELPSFDLAISSILAFAAELYCSRFWSMPMHHITRAGARNVKRTQTLTKRQEAILVYLDLGWTNERIARELNFSIATIKSDLASIYDYFNCNNRHDAVKKFKNGPPVPDSESIQGLPE